MDLKLKGKRALVTGSSSGLGKAIAKMLAHEGAAVVIHGRDEARASAVAREIRDQGGRASVVLGDLSCDAGADAVASGTLKDGQVDILVNNAGAYHHLGWMETDAKVWTETYQVNVISAVRLIQQLVPLMKKNKWGRVIQIGGGLAIQPIPMQPDYNASLAARHNLAVSLARELKESGVTSNAIAPGAILVDSVEQLLREIAPKFKWGSAWEDIEKGAVRDMVPNDIGRLGRPDEIAGAVSYLCSPFADYISGAIIRVDGGTIRSL